MTSRNLFLSILAMDAYNRGYNSGLAGLSDAQDTSIGDAHITFHSSSDPSDPAFKAGFYAEAYKWGDETVISYRGTDDRSRSSSSDIVNGWLAALGQDTAQVDLARQFYHDVTGLTADGSSGPAAGVVLTGHSLGGGLAGMISALTGTTGVGFDYMPPAIIATALSQASGTPLHWVSFTGVHVDNEIMQSVRDGSIQATLGFFAPAVALDAIGLYFGLNLSEVPPNQQLISIAAQTKAINDTIQDVPLSSFSGLTSLGDRMFVLHAQDLLVLLQYASETPHRHTDWQTIAGPLLGALFDADLGTAIGQIKGATGTAGEDGQLRTMVAYSAIDTVDAQGNPIGQPFGDKAIVSLFDDADQLGRLYPAAGPSNTLLGGSGVKKGLAEIIVQFAGDLAKAADTVTGGGAVNVTNGIMTVDLDPAKWVSTFGSSGQHTVVGVADLVAGLRSYNPPATVPSLLGSPVNWQVDAGTIDTSHITRIVATTDSGSAILHVANAPDASGHTPGGALIIGGQAADDLDGGDGGDWLIGGEGDDSLSGGRGDDSFVGGHGNDTIDGGDGANTAFYDQPQGHYDVRQLGSRKWEVTFHPNLLGGGSALASDGTDILYNIGKLEFADGERIIGDTVSSSQPDSTAGTGAGSFTSDGGINPTGGGVSGSESTASAPAGTVTKNGTDEAEQIYGTGGPDLIHGNGGNDILTGNAGQDTLDGGQGIDTADYSYEPADVSGVVNLGDGNGTAVFAGYYTETLTSIENVWMGAGNDSVVGDSGDNDLRGGPGNDTLQGGLGNDRIYGDWKYSDQGGNDTAILSYAFGSGYTISGSTNALHIVGADGDDWYYNIENFVFAGGVTKAATELAIPSSIPTIEVQEQLVSSASGGVNVQPNVTPLSGGGYVVVWTDQTTSGAYQIKARLYDANAQVTTTELAVNTTTSNLSSVRACANQSGGFVVAWQDSSSAILARYYNAAGEATTASDIAVVDSSQGVNTFQQVIQLAGGGTLFTWVDQAYTLQGELIDPAGISTSLALGGYWGYKPTALPNGGFAIVFGDRTGRSWEVREFDSSGAEKTRFQLGSEFSEHQVVALANGNLLVYWLDGYYGPGMGIHAKIFDPSGNVIGLPIDLRPAGEHFPNEPSWISYDINGSPSVAPLADGGFMVAWSNSSGNTIYSHTKVQQFSSYGVPVGPEFLATDLRAYDFQPGVHQNAPSAATLTDGNVVVAWYATHDIGGTLVWDGIRTATVTPGIGADLAPVAEADLVGTAADRPLFGNLLADNGFGADGDPEGEALTVTAANGNADAIGHLVILSSGASLVVNPDGRFVYDPNGKFDALNAGQTATDSFTYTITDGQGHAASATATVTIQGTQHGLAITNGSGVITGTSVDDQIACGAGNETVHAGGGYDWVQGGEGADALYGDDGSDVIQGDGGADSLAGGAGFDWLVGGAGNDTLDGGADSDVASYSGNAADYVIVRNAVTGQIIVRDIRIGSPEGTDSVINVETFAFADGSIALSDIAANAPTDILLSAQTVAENSPSGTVIGGLSAIDADAVDTFTYQLIDNPGGLFAIDGTNLVVAGALDYEQAASRTIKVQVSDAAGNTFDKSLTIAVGNINEAPTGITLSASSVAENAAGAVIGTVAASDPDAGDTHTFACSDDRFEVAGGRLKLRDGVSLDYENESSVNLTIAATDAGGLSFSKGFTISVVDVNEAPTAVAIGGVPASLPESVDTSVRVEVGSIQITDDALGANTVTLSGADAALFEVVGSRLYIRAGAVIDFETNPRLDVTVTVSDQGIPGAAPVSADVSIAVTNVGGVVITGTTGNDRVDASHTVAGQPLPSGEEDLISGGAGNDSISGLGGNDIIEGGAGADKLDGGAGIDTASYAHSAVAVNVSLARQGGGSLGSPASPAAVAQIGGDAAGDLLWGFENLMGSNFADVLTGDVGANSIRGGLGNDTISGGAGDDTLAGEGGSDTLSYAAAAAGVVVDLTAGTAGDGFGGADLLSGFEKIAGSAWADQLTGDAFNNVLSGATGDDTLDGGGGADTLAGGIGNDTYLVGNVGVVVSEAAGQGVDTVKSSVSFVLGANLENLTLLGAGPINGTGNAARNRLVGNEADNLLVGLGGADTIEGGGGFDTVSYATSAAAVRLSLGAGGGASTAGIGGDAAGDIVSNVENIVGSAFADTLVGNDIDNVLSGGSGADKLLGGLGADLLYGGAGADTLTGGDGPDTFKYVSLSDRGDHIVDFESGVDHFLIMSGGFAHLAAGLANLQFGTVATGGNATFLYDALSGRLWYDGDGSGIGAKQLLASLDNKPTALAAMDISIV